MKAHIMDEDSIKKMFIFVLLIGGLLVSTWFLAKEANFMLNSEPVTVEVVGVSTSKSRKRGKLKSGNGGDSITFAMVDGDHTVKNYKMKTIMNLHKPGDVIPGGHNPKTGVLVSHKHAKFHMFISFILLLFFGLTTWGAFKYRDQI